jgi:WD40 repeat protein
MRKNMDTSSTPVVIAREVISIPQDPQDSSRNDVMRLAWHPSGQAFAVIDSQLHVLIFNAITKQLSHKLPKLSSVRSSNYPVVAYSPDGLYMAAGKDVISIFAAQTGKKIRDIISPYPEQHDARGGGVNSLVFSPNSQVLAVAYSKYWSAEQTESKEILATYELATGKLLFAVNPPAYHSRSSISTNIVYTVDGKYLLAGRWSLLPYAEQVKTGEPFRYFTFIDYIDSQTGQLTQSISPVHVMLPTALGISPDGRYVASGTDTGSNQTSRRPHSDKWDYINNQDPVRLWDITTRKLVREYPIQHSVKALAISPDGRYLAVHHNLEIVLFDFVSGHRLQTIKLPGTPGFSLSLQLGFSPDSKKLAIPLDDHIYLFTLQ